MSERKFVPYVRVKRRHQTVFIEAQPGDTFLSVKEQLGALFGLAPVAHSALAGAQGQQGALGRRDARRP
ncbi:hypothetical protein PINS_up015683 [Pythium insidiosum]|nr:hypothetical protein PINS_up015683 [Pythium insidiosum]